MKKVQRQSSILTHHRDTISYCWTDDHCFMNFEMELETEYHAGCFSLLSCWHQTRKWGNDLFYTHICAHRTTHAHVITEEEVSLLLPDADTFQLPDSGLGAAADWGQEPEDSGGITATPSKKEKRNSNQWWLKLWCKKKDLLFLF